MFSYQSTGGTDISGSQDSSVKTNLSKSQANTTTFLKGRTPFQMTSLRGTSLWIERRPYLMGRASSLIEITSSIIGSPI